ncbi:hypothetical protein SARC_10678 [Sphaeroforma arctica JP610]|uniref:Uncharacterized protein n=1 Tax=Sphaeroforma arctica JP610 TaxID=667725 RepID=A0A0L0FJ85_9EUKA|nr:hypothetical protein SARC_10678 [Sphaeroforma arctica JP610]KNC76847.1 hypothetical protein SARC_10678 [Sphaeroforma arctica JP610]|eukprot:XP_014150749.1 hypothetical protein SARC_10678 [Sphaeroforma arctica JP610]
MRASSESGIQPSIEAEGNNEQTLTSTITQSAGAANNGRLQLVADDDDVNLDGDFYDDDEAMSWCTEGGKGAKEVVYNQQIQAEKKSGRKARPPIGLAKEV